MRRPRSSWGSPYRALGRRERGVLQGEGAEPVCFIGAGFQFDGYGPFFWKIDSVNLARLGQAIGVLLHQFVMRLCLPPLETGEEINHVLVSLKHHHGVDPTT